MKLLILMLTFVSLSAQANPVPQELMDLLPAGGNSVRMVGKTSDNKKCAVAINSMSPGIFSATLAVLDNNDQVDSRRFAKFQLGLGHSLYSLQNNKTTLVAVSGREAEEQYSSNIQSQLVVEKTDSFISSVQIVLKQKGFLGRMKTKVNEKCQF